MSILNFAFGSHLDMERYCEMIGGKPMMRTPAALNDYRLASSALIRFPQKHANLAGEGGGPRLVPHQGSKVNGVLYEITSSQWELLDRYEREWAYQPIEIKVKTQDGNIVKALAHNLVEHGGFLAPSPMFLFYMTRGLRDLGYSEEVIEQVMRSVSEKI